MIEKYNYLHLSIDLLDDRRQISWRPVFRWNNGALCRRWSTPGGYAQAAAALHKSQSAVTYAVQKIERQLKVKLFEIQGRKAHLTPSGRLLYRRAQALLEEAGAVE